MQNPSLWKKNKCHWSKRLFVKFMISRFILFNLIRYAVCNPQSQRDIVCRYIETLYSIKTLPLPNFLSITLTPSNQIIHPGFFFLSLKVTII